MLVSNPDIVRRMFVVIMLDFSQVASSVTQPWNFMTEIDRWVRFLRQLLEKAGLTINQLDEMKERVQKYYTSFKEPLYDEEGKFLKYNCFYAGNLTRRLLKRSRFQCRKVCLLATCAYPSSYPSTKPTCRPRSSVTRTPRKFRLYSITCAMHA